MKFKNFDIEDVFGFDDAEQAKAYIGKKGYYADHIEKLDDYIENKSHIDTLYTINKSRDIYRFMVGCSYDYCGYYTYFLPLEKVKKTEPTETKVTYRYRPFRTIAEVDEVLAKDNVKHYCFVGSGLYLRYKAKPNITKQITITNLEVDTKTNRLLFINSFTPKYLVKTFEIKLAGEWFPFGVEVKDE